ncbi:uncharacterized protein LOC115723869 [Cannabis sativa]|uniref:uncharacterized protein LOC115723869 n=1 Tax=Cannabis sativa TaxID=3483 RepID=UPI0029CA80B3|nr:uncharacterized protein LOC115723869 [Cannabis sativa]
MASSEIQATFSIVRPTTRSQDGIPPSTSENHQSESNPDTASAPPFNEQDNLAPAHSSPDPVADIPQPPVHTRRSSLVDRLAHEDVSSPFFLSTADHPGLVLVSTILNRANYQSWKKEITMALTAKEQVMSWLVNSVSSVIAQSIMYFDLATDLWHDLQERFNEGSGPRIFQLQTQLTRLQQGDQSVTSYFSMLKSIWDKLRELQPNTTCTCGAMKLFLEYYNQNQVLQFFTSLNESYASVRAQILFNEPIPNLSRVFAMIVKEERQHTLGSLDASSLAASARSSSNNPPPRSKKPRPSCTNCGTPGHYVDKCYFIHEIPPGNGDKKKPDKSKPAANQASSSSDVILSTSTHTDLSPQC